MLRKCSPTPVLHVWRVTCQVWCVSCHVSRVTYHMSGVTCHFFCRKYICNNNKIVFFFQSKKVVKLVRRGSVINGATPSSLYYMSWAGRISGISTVLIFTELYRDLSEMHNCKPWWIELVTRNFSSQKKSPLSNHQRECQPFWASSSPKGLWSRYLNVSPSTWRRVLLRLVCPSRPIYRKYQAWKDLPVILKILFHVFLSPFFPFCLFVLTIYCNVGLNVKE